MKLERGMLNVDAPELTWEVAERAQIAVGGKVIRPATGTLTKRGRPPIGDEPKQQVTLRLARHFKDTGEGWQTRLNEALEEYVVRDAASGKLSRTRRASSFQDSKKRRGIAVA